jgi:hypothetical protein
LPDGNSALFARAGVREIRQFGARTRIGLGGLLLGVSVLPAEREAQHGKKECGEKN